MGIYRIYKDNWENVAHFDNEAAAQARADSLGSGYLVEFVGNDVIPTAEERLWMDQHFCKELVDIFLKDNRAAGVTGAQGESLMGKFATALSLAQVGSVTSVNYHITNMAVDSIFTQERKDKYLTLIQKYLSQF